LAQAAAARAGAASPARAGALAGPRALH